MYNETNLHLEIPDYLLPSLVAYLLWGRIWINSWCRRCGRMCPFLQLISEDLTQWCWTINTTTICGWYVPLRRCLTHSAKTYPQGVVLVGLSVEGDQIECPSTQGGLREGCLAWRIDAKVMNGMRWSG